MATAEYFIPPVRYLLFRASAAFFRSASSRSLWECRVAISNLLFGRRLREVLELDDGALAWRSSNAHRRRQM